MFTTISNRKMSDYERNEQKFDFEIDFLSVTNLR